MVKLIAKAIVINVKIHKNERKSLKHVSMKLLQVSLSCLHFSEGEVRSLFFTSDKCGELGNYATLDTIPSFSFLIHGLQQNIFYHWIFNMSNMMYALMEQKLLTLPEHFEITPFSAGFMLLNL